MAEQREETARFSRRQVVAAGALAAVAGAGIGGPTVLRRLRDATLGASVDVPTISTKVRDLSFDSGARSRRVTTLITAAPTAKADTPVVVWLHGRGDRARTVMDDLKLPNFLAAHLAAGNGPLAVVAIDGGDRYWHRRIDGDDPEAMVVRELPAVLENEGIRPSAWGIAGWSMGGFGALSIASRTKRFGAVAASSAAVWKRFADARPGAFDSADDFDAHDVFTHRSMLPPAIRIDCGTSDAFASTNAELRRILTGSEGALVEGGHSMRFWRSVVPAQLQFFATALR